MLLVLSCVLICIPVIVGLFKLPQNSIVVGCNSFAIATSCHVSPLSQVDELSDDGAESEAGLELLVCNRLPTVGLALIADDASRELLVRISQSELKWGVIRVPNGWPLQDADDLEEDAPSVGHISFGTKMDVISVPVAGNLYA